MAPISPAQGQTCLGGADFAKNYLQSVGQYRYSPGLEVLDASVGIGGRSAFGGIGFTASALVDGEPEIAGRATLGYQVPINNVGSVQVCPVLRVSHGIPSQSLFGFGVDELSHSYGLGLNIGAELFRVERVTMLQLLMAGVQWDVVRAADGFAADRFSDRFVYTGLGFALIVNDALATRAALLFPLKSRIDEAALSLGVSLNYGGRR